jgi:hypothetical protein
MKLLINQLVSHGLKPNQYLDQVLIAFQLTQKI